MKKVLFALTMAILVMVVLPAMAASNTISGSLVRNDEYRTGSFSVPAGEEVTVVVGEVMEGHPNPPDNCTNVVDSKGFPCDQGQNAESFDIQCKNTLGQSVFSFQYRDRGPEIEEWKSYNLQASIPAGDYECEIVWKGRLTETDSDDPGSVSYNFTFNSYPIATATSSPTNTPVYTATPSNTPDPLVTPTATLTPDPGQSPTPAPSSTPNIPAPPSSGYECTADIPQGLGGQLEVYRFDGTYDNVTGLPGTLPYPGAWAEQSIKNGVGVIDIHTNPGFPMLSGPFVVRSNSTGAWLVIGETSQSDRCVIVSSDPAEEIVALRAVPATGSNELPISAQNRPATFEQRVVVVAVCLIALVLFVSFVTIINHLKKKKA